MTARKFLLVIISFFAILSVFSSVLAYDTNNTLFDPEFYTSNFEDANVYDKLPGIMADQLSDKLENEIEDLSRQEIHDVIMEAMPAEWVRTNMSTIVNGVLDYINEDTDILIGSVDLESIKGNLESIVERDYPEKDIESIIGNIPDNVALSEMIHEDDLSGAIDMSSLFRSSLSILYVITALLLLLIILLGKDIFEKIRYFGIVIFVAGLALSAMIYALNRFIQNIISDAEGEQLFGDIIDALSSSFSGTIMNHGLILLAFGLALIIVALIFGRREIRS